MNLPAPLSLKPERPPVCLAPTSLPLLQPQWLLHPGPLHMPFCLPRATLPQAFTPTPFSLFYSHPLPKLAHVPPPTPISAIRSIFCPFAQLQTWKLPLNFSLPPYTQPICQIWPLSRPHLQPASSLGTSAPGGFQIDSWESAPQAILFIPGDLDLSGWDTGERGMTRNADRAPGRGVSAALTHDLLLSTDLPYLAPDCRLGSQIHTKTQRELVTCPRSHSHSLQIQE